MILVEESFTLVGSLVHKAFRLCVEWPAAALSHAPVCNLHEQSKRPKVVVVTSHHLSVRNDHDLDKAWW